LKFTGNCSGFETGTTLWRIDRELTDLSVRALQTPGGLTAATDDGLSIAMKYEHESLHQHRSGGGGGQQQSPSMATSPDSLPGAGCKKRGPPSFQVTVVMS
jgi:hypothetical protein